MGQSRFEHSLYRLHALGMVVSHGERRSLVSMDCCHNDCNYERSSTAHCNNKLLGDGPGDDDNLFDMGAAMEINWRDWGSRSFDSSFSGTLDSFYSNGGWKSRRSGNVFAAAGTDAPRPLVGTLVVYTTCKATL